MARRMKSAFSEFYKPTEDELKALWKDSLFVIDANVVLNLYRYPSTVRDDLLKSLENVADRLWMPFQAAYEYQRKRLDVIAEQKKAFDNIKNELKASVSKMQGLFTARHPLIEQGTLVAKVRELVDEYVEKLQPLSDMQPAVHDDDSIREKVDQLLSGKIGPEPSKEAVESMCADGQERYERKIPPGFMDAKKEEVHHFRGVRYEGKFGDLLLWRQVLEHAKSLGCKSVIFITDDTKEDWWQIISGKTIGPLPALKAEMKSAAGVDNFHMYTTESFLRFSEQFLKTKINPQTIDQVAKINEAASVASLKHYFPRESLRERFDGDCYLIETDYNGRTSRVALRNTLYAVVQNRLPLDTFHFVDVGDDIELYTMIEGVFDEVATALISVPGVTNVSFLEPNKRWLRLPPSNLVYVSREENAPRRFYDLKITLSPGDIDENQAINWIKMVLNKELQAVEPKEMRRFSINRVSGGLTATIHVPLLYNEGQKVRASIAALESVYGVHLIDTSMRG